MSSLLLETLKDGLDPALAARLSNEPELRNDAEKYLQDILVNEQIFSTESFTTTSALKDDAGASQKTMTEEIAELDFQLRQVELKLAALTDDNRDLIIDISMDLKNVNNKIHTDFEQEINALNTSLASIKTSLDTRSMEKLSSAIHSSNSILSSLDSILDIYELPALCGLCIMQGNYQEALEIATMVKMLLIKFPHLKTFTALQQQINKAMDAMVKGLIRLLNTNLKQSNIFKIFHILNRPNLLSSDGFSSSSSSASEQKVANNHQLKLLYLNSRFKYITDEVDSLKPLLKLKNATYLKRYIEIYREHLFNSISVFFSIFGGSAEDTNDKHLLNQFVKSLANLLVDDIRKHLPAIEENVKEDDPESKSMVDGIILQVIYLCRSLSKFGLDFESLVTWSLCTQEPIVVSEEDWVSNLAKVKKFRS